MPQHTPTGGDSSRPMTFRESYEGFGFDKDTAYYLLRNGRYPVPVEKLGSRWKVSRQAQAQVLAKLNPCAS